jgi:iron donor protein CyaY
MNETEFTELAKHTLSSIADTIETTDIEGLIDMDFNFDMINLKTEDGIFVINKHSAAKEIWLASPLSGPYHFFHKDGKWQTHGNIDLFDVLSRELKMKFGEI